MDKFDKAGCENCWGGLFRVLRIYAFSATKVPRYRGEVLEIYVAIIGRQKAQSALVGPGWKTHQRGPKNKKALDLVDLRRLGVDWGQ